MPGNMNEQYEMGMRFVKMLMDFNMSLRGSMQELERAHENVSPYWQDDMRKLYDQIWGPFHQTMQHYDKVEGPSYVEFLNIKMYATRRYLQGG